MEVAAVAIAVLCILSWQSQDRSVEFVRHPRAKETPREVNSEFRAIVSFWILSILFAMSYIRLVIASLLFTSIKKMSVNMAYAWMAMKLFACIMAIFLSLGAMTVGYYTRVAALADLGFHLITLYYIKVLYDSLADMQRANDRLISKKDTKEPL